MATNVGSIYYDLKLDTSKFDAASAKIKTQLSTIGTQANKAGYEVEKSTGNAGSSFMAGAGKAGLYAAAIAGIGFAAYKSISPFISIASEAENLRANLDVLTGSAEKGANMFKQITDFAAKTPFESTELVAASQQMLSFGIAQEKILPNLQMLGDIAMGNKEKLAGLTYAFSQVQSTGRLMGQDLLQMINNGFNPLEIISKKTGESMADLKKRMEEGGISAQEVADAMAAATAEGGRFYGGMDKASKTLSGRMSTLSDNAKMAIRSIMGIDQEGNIKEGGLFDRTSKNLEKLFPLMEKLANEYGPKIGDFFAKIGKIGGDVFGEILDNMKPVFDYLKNNDTLLQTLKWTFIAIAAVIGTILLGAFGLIVGILVIIKAIVEASIWTWNALVAAFEWVIIAVMNVIQWFKDLYTNISQKVTDIQNAISEKFDSVKNKINETMDNIKQKIEDTWNTIKQKFEDAKNNILKSVDDTKQGIINRWNDIRNSIINIVNGIIGFFGGAWGWLYGAGRNIIQGFVNGIHAMWGSVWGAVSSVASSAMGAVGGAGGWLYGAGRNLIQGFINGIKDMFGSVRGTLGDLTNKVKDWKGPPSKDKVLLVHNAQLIMGGFISGLKNEFNSVKDTFGSLTNNIPASINTSVGQPTSQATTNNIYGNITLGDTAAVDRFFDRLGRNSELAQKGMATI